MSKRKGHLLNKPKTTKTPQYFCFVDVETEQERDNNERVIHHLSFGVAIFVRYRKDNKPTKQEEFIFSSEDNFWNKCLQFVRGKNTLHIIAHNALFDLTVLRFRTELTKRGFECKFIFDQGLTFISKWKRKGLVLLFLDNSNWFQGKLSKWGDMLGLPKLEFPGENDSYEIWLEYCKRDTMILVKLQDWYIRFLEDNNLGNWKYTLASQAFNIFRYRFMNNPIYIPNEEQETELARNSYKGGRTECFYSGKAKKQTYYKLDVNSMYPFVMKEQEYPTSLVCIRDNPKIKYVKRALENYAAIAYVDVNTSHNFIPYPVNGKTCYPVGKFSCYVSTAELLLLLQNGEIENVHRIAYYRKRRIFTDFVDFFYGKRLEYKAKGEILTAYMFKGVLNRLYGKFGQRKYEDTIIGKAKEGSFKTSYYYNHTTGVRGIIRQIGENIILSTKGEEGFNSFVAIASHVTAWARVLLYQYISLAGKDNVYYSDTDSLIVNEAGLSGVRDYISNDKLGFLKVEGVSDYLEIIAPKHYYFGEVVVRKGVSAKSPHLGNGVYKQEIWPRLNKLLNEDNEYYFNYFIDKHLTAKVSSGIISSGGRVKPFIIER